jgi:hypothetical protein
LPLGILVQKIFILLEKNARKRSTLSIDFN